MFDKNKVLTTVTAEQAEVGSLGWFGDTLKGVEEQTKRQLPKELEAVHGYEYKFRFQVKDGDAYSYFLPAPYSYFQAKWVKENNLKVGDKVEVVRGWKRWEKGFSFSQGAVDVGDKGPVIQIEEESIRVNIGSGTFHSYPYFAIEKVEGEYRPYSKEALAGLVGETLVRNGNYPEESIRRVLVVGYSDGKIIVPSSVGNLHYDAQGVLDCFRHVTGNPAGVKL
jgi:hypothetical protein